MSENYFYAGVTHNHHLFIHTEFEDKWTHEIDSQIMNIMIHETRITNPNEKCIVFTTTKEDGILATIIDHIDADNNHQYDNENIKSLYLQAFNKFNGGKHMIYKYLYDTQHFETYEMEMDFGTKIYTSDFKIKILRVVTKKELL